MAPGNIEAARRSMRTRPIVRSATAAAKLVVSLRRLGADEKTVAQVAAQLHRRPPAT